MIILPSQKRLQSPIMQGRNKWTADESTFQVWLENIFGVIYLGREQKRWRESFCCQRKASKLLVHVSPGKWMWIFLPLKSTYSPSQNLASSSTNSTKIAQILHSRAHDVNLIHDRIVLTPDEIRVFTVKFPDNLRHRRPEVLIVHQGVFDGQPICMLELKATVSEKIGCHLEVWILEAFGDVYELFWKNRVCVHHPLLSDRSQVAVSVPCCLAHVSTYVKLCEKVPGAVGSGIGERCWSREGWAIFGLRSLSLEKERLS